MNHRLPRNPDKDNAEGARLAYSIAVADHTAAKADYEAGYISQADYRKAKKAMDKAGAALDAIRRGSP